MLRACISYLRRSPSSPGSPYRQRLEAVAAQGIAGLVAMRIRQEFDLQTGCLGVFQARERSKSRGCAIEAFYANFNCATAKQNGLQNPINHSNDG